MLLVYLNYWFEGKTNLGSFCLSVENKKCPPFCTIEYEPVCASNGKTYLNLCRLHFADCEFENDEEITLKHLGACEGQGMCVS